MKLGFVMPPDDPSRTVAHAVEAEQRGWDGFFLSDSMWSLDPWICLAGAAVRTERIRLGTLLSPLSAMRPWKLAASAATLDRLSGGRAILTVGMGAPDTGFADWGEAVDLKTRAELVDEGLALMRAVWRGEPFTFSGKHYRVQVQHLPMPPPRPSNGEGVRLWVVGAWPRPKSMQRALEADGLVLYVKPKGENGRAPVTDDVRAVHDWLNARGSRAEIVVEGQTPGDDLHQATQILEGWREAGAAWWIESWWGDPAERLARLRQGPP